jgi:hypothetical protein
MHGAILGWTGFHKWAKIRICTAESYPPAEKKQSGDNYPREPFELAAENAKNAEIKSVVFSVLYVLSSPLKNEGHRR